MKARIEIDTRTFVRFWLVVIGFALAAFAIYSARSALIIISTAMFLAIALSPPVNHLVKILPSKSRVLSTAIAYSVVLAIIGIIVFLVIPPIIDQTVKFMQHFPSLVDSAVDQSRGVSDFANHYQLQPQVDKIVGSLNNSVTRSVTSVGPSLVASIGSILSAVTATILILVLTFLMLVESPAWLRRLWSVYRNKKRLEHHKALLGQMYKTVTSYVTGQLTVSTIAGTVAGIMVFILSLLFNIPASLSVPSAAIVFVLSLIPMFGEVIGALLITFILLLNNVTAAIIFLIIIIVYQQIEANYISPKIQSKRIDLSALAILISVTIGIYLFGIVGGIISIPIAGSLKVLVDDYLARVKQNHTNKKQTT